MTSQSMASNQSPRVWFTDKHISAEISEMPLKSVLAHFEGENRIELKGHENLFNEKVSVEFKRLSIENGLKRILDRFNYAILYDGLGKPIKVYVFDKAEPGSIVTTIHQMGTHLPHSPSFENERATAPPERKTVSTGIKKSDRRVTISEEEKEMFTLEGKKPEFGSSVPGSPQKGRERDSLSENMKTPDSPGESIITDGPVAPPL